MSEDLADLDQRAKLGGINVEIKKVEKVKGTLNAQKGRLFHSLLFMLPQLDKLSVLAIINEK